MYTSRNFRTKKAFKDAVANGEQVTLYQPGPFGGDARDGEWATVEGPHYPAPHTWYAQAFIQNGIVIKVK